MYSVGVADKFHRVAMGPAPALPPSANDRHVRFSLATTAFNPSTDKPPTLTPNRANGLPFSLLTSDRS